MEIRYRQYPYPVLMNESDDYSSTFSFSVSVEMGIREIIIHGSVDLNDDEMTELIRKGDAEYVIHIECPTTSYREVLRFSTDHFEKHIPENELNEKTAICCFVVARKDLTGYTNRNFNTDYKGISFDIERGSIIAIAGQWNADIVKDTEDLGKIPSIFSIGCKADDTDDSMKIDLDKDKIAVMLCNETYRNYSSLTHMPSLLPVFHAAVIYPVLIYTFEELRKTGTEEYEQKRWFISISHALKKHNIELNAETLLTNDSYLLAQKLLDLPVNRALNAIVTLDASGEEE